MAEHLSALDATFLELEEADPSAHMHIGGVLVLEPQPGGGAPPLDRIREQVFERLPGLPRYTQRLSEPKTGGLRFPSWEQDMRFNIAHHVFSAPLPSPGGTDELLEWAGDYYSSRLNRTGPLWQMVVLELADGRWAVVTKTHHCMIDGVGSVDMASTLFDAEAEPAASSDVSPAAEPVAPPPSWRRVASRVARPGLAAGHAAVRGAQRGLQAAESALGVVAHPERTRDAARRSKALAELLVRDELVAAPRTSLNDPIGTTRRLAVFEVDLEELKAIKRSLGGTVNDVVLAASAGGFRRLLETRGEEPPPAGLRAMVPMNIRTAGDQLAMGNRISSLFVHLPVAAEDAATRYELQLEEAEALKAGDQAEGSTTMINLAGNLPPVLHSFAARALFATRLFNVTITNVPGPQFPLYCLGSRVETIWPLVPIAAEHAVGLAVMSYDGRVFFCLNVDRDTVPDLDVLSAGISDSLEELRELAAVRG